MADNSLTQCWHCLQKRKEVSLAIHVPTFVEGSESETESDEEVAAIGNDVATLSIGI